MCQVGAVWADWMDAKPEVDMSERKKFEAWRKSAGLQNMGASHSLYALHAWQAAKSESAAEIAALKAQKDGAYLERNRCVALIAQMAIALGLKAGKARTAIEGWSDDWHGCIYIDLPAGQVSWHYHDSQAFLFDALPAYEGKWDGHDTEEKYRRVGLPFESELRKQLEEARKDAERLTFFEAHPDMILSLGAHWYKRAGYGMPVRRFNTLRAAIDAAKELGK